VASIELKKSVCRILTDLVKSDNVISVDEMDILEDAAKAYGLTKENHIDSYAMSLADAAAYVATQKPQVKDRVVKLMESCALKDGECCREEALLISSIEIENEGKGRILSMPMNNRPILSSQILFVDATYNPRKNDLDRNYDEMSRIVEMAGFELIYVPKVAMNYKVMKRGEDLKRLLSIVNPTLSESALVSKVMSLQDMDSRYFYLQVLNGRLQMGITIQRPSWLIRLPNSVVSGRGYANYLCFDVDMDDIKSQLISFVEGLNRRQNPYTVLVNRHTDRSKDFLYGGFHKALLDVMASDKVEPWEVRVYVRAGRNPVVDKSEPGKKFTIEICKGNARYPVLINGREAAFYLLLLCGSAGPQRGIDFEYDRENSKRVQAQFIEAYHLVSNREDHFPDITLSSTFRPIKTKVMKGLEECGIKGELHLFKPTKTGKNTYYVPVNSQCVKIISREGSTPLVDSAIYRTFSKCLTK
jgi:hypothetical protein